MKIKKETAIKILAAMLTILMLTICMGSTVFASETSAGTSDLLNPNNVKGTTSTESNKIQTIGNKILGVVQVVAITIAVIMLVVLAIKYLTSSPNEKADVKKSAMTYVIGAVVLFGASGILQIIKTFVDDATKTKS